MSDDIDRALEAANWPVDLAASIRELVASLQPGEVLVYDESDGLAFYDRREARFRRVVDRVWLDGGVGEETTSAIIGPEIAAMVERGELVYGPGCSEWYRPA